MHAHTLITAVWLPRVTAQVVASAYTPARGPSSHRQQQQQQRRQPLQHHQRLRVACAASSDSYRSKAAKDIKVLIVGPTGYIGRAVVKEYVKQGYNVVAFAREKAGIKGKMTKEDTIKVGGGRAQGIRWPTLKVPCTCTHHGGDDVVHASAPLPCISIHHFVAPFARL